MHLLKAKAKAKVLGMHLLKAKVLAMGMHLLKAKVLAMHSLKVLVKPSELVSSIQSK